jgi:hypothetical protein
MLVVKEGRYFSRTWFFDGPGLNWLGALYRDGGEPWVFMHRFRYYGPEDEGDPQSRDARSWWTTTIDGATPEAEVVAKLDVLARGTRDLVAKKIGERQTSAVSSTRFGSDDVEEVSRTLMAQSWAHPSTTGPRVPGEQ